MLTMAIADDRIDRLRAMIEIAEMKGEGDEPRTDRLRAELVEALRGDCPPDEDWGEDEADDEDGCDAPLPAAMPDVDAAPDLKSLPVAERIKRRLQDYGAFELGQLSAWNARLLRQAVGPRDAHLVRRAMAKLGVGHLLASSGDVLPELPPKSPLATDVRDGRTLEDCQRILAALAEGELTQRTGSSEAGGKEHAGWHQRIGSMFDRHSDIAAPYFELALRRHHGDAPWFVGVSIVQIPGAVRRVWGLRLISRWSEADTVADLDRRDRLRYNRARTANLNPGKGRGEATKSWGGISLLVEQEGE